MPLRNSPKPPARNIQRGSRILKGAPAPPVTSGPPIGEMSQPAGTRVMILRGGLVMTSLVYPAAAPSPLAPAPALHGPVRAKIPQPPPRGQVISRTSVLGTTGPPLTALDGPVTAPRRAMPSVRRQPLSTKIAAALAPAATSGPPLTPLRQPVTVSRRGPPSRGRAVATATPVQGMQFGAMPGYLYPTFGNAWANFTASTGKLPSVVILNSGNGDVPWNSDYETLCSQLHARGITVLGYTYTNFGTRPAATVEAAVGNYLGAGITPGGNGVDGIFLDLLPSAAGSFAYLSGICSSIASQFAAGGGSNNPPIWGNPGTTIDSSYLALPISTFITFEGDIYAYQDATPFNISVSGTPVSGQGLYPRSRFCHTVYNVGRNDADGVADRAWANYAGWAFTTNGGGTDNPYQVIPANDYLNDLGLRIASEPVPQTVGMPPPAAPLTQPVRARLPRVQPRGKALAIAGIPVTAPPVTSGPPVTPLHQPAGPRNRPLPARGQVTARTNVLGTPGPKIPPPGQSAGVRVTAARKGSVFSSPVIVTVTYSTSSGPPVTALDGPVRSKLPRPWLHGSGRGLRPVKGFTGPPVTALDGPVTPRVRVQPPRGVTQGLHPVKGFTGPPVTALDGPVSIRKSLPPRGTAQGLRPAGGTAGPKLTPLKQPVRARFPLPPRGRAIVGSRGVPPGTFVSGPPISTPLHQPVSTRRLTLPPPGRAMAIAAFPVLPTSAGPPLTPLKQPVSIRHALPPRGQAFTGGRGGPSVTLSSGPPILSAGQPAGLRVLYARTGYVRRSPLRPPAAAAPATGPAIQPRGQAAGVRVVITRAGNAQTSGPFLAKASGTGATESGPWNIWLPGGWAKIRYAPFSPVLPKPGIALAGFAGTNGQFRITIPKPAAALAAKTVHQPLKLVIPAPRTTLAAKDLHNPFNIRIPAPKTTLAAKVIHEPLNVKVPAPRTGLAAKVVHNPLKLTLPLPRTTLAAKVVHQPLAIRIPAPKTTLAAKVIHDPFNIRVPLPRITLAGFRAHAGSFAITFGWFRPPPGPFLPRRDTAPSPAQAPVPPAGSGRVTTTVQPPDQGGSGRISSKGVQTNPRGPGGVS